ncbi:MAG: toxic anion resistance protein, partial [Oscillospiraceae bacterium]|nr:toxic anion resistance protein [Oscillospiraceae bacterium]
MTDNNMPELTLEPTATATEMPELTLESVPTPATPEVKAEPEEDKSVKLDESMLTEEERKAVEEFSKKIDVKDSNMVLNYGAAAQKSVASFSENALASV